MFQENRGNSLGRSTEYLRRSWLPTILNPTTFAHFLVFSATPVEQASLIAFSPLLHSRTSLQPSRTSLLAPLAHVSRCGHSRCLIALTLSPASHHAYSGHPRHSRRRRLVARCSHRVFRHPRLQLSKPYRRCPIPSHPSFSSP